MKLVRFVLAAVALLCAAPAVAEDYTVERGFLRVQINGRTWRLEASFTKRSDASGRLPIALITHGSTDSPAQRLNQHVGSLEPQARDFAWRGYLAVAVMRRGFGSSDGPLPAPTTCPVKSYTNRFNADADDLQGALEAVAKRPDADAGTAIAVGVSAGGPAVMALGARNPAGLKAVINVSGGLVSLACPKEEVLIDAVKTFTAGNKVPQLWIYAANDSLFGPPLVDRMHETALDAGADVKIIRLDNMGRDGHDIFATADGRFSWLAETDGFLRAYRLPTWNYSEVARLMNVLKLRNTDRSFVESYMAAPTLKAMARSASGETRRYFYNARNVEGVRDSALNACNKPEDPCEIVMENGRVVASWTQPAEKAPTANVAAPGAQTKDPPATTTTGAP